MTPTCLIIRTAGTNCDRELAHAFQLAGAKVQTVHLNRLIEEPNRVTGADIIGVPGGFSYGDDIAAGRILANRLKHRLFDAFREAVANGTPIIGICNGFQVLVKMGLLPDPVGGKQTCTLAENTSGRFIDRWVKMRAAADSACIWTRDLGDFVLPIAHGEGRFVTDNDATLATLQEQNQVALRYDASDNPNGSVDDIAGICDPTGVVLGLMPHPERFVHPTHHPHWTRLGGDWLTQTPAGLKVIRNAVTHVTQQSAATV